MFFPIRTAWTKGQVSIFGIYKKQNVTEIPNKCSQRTNVPAITGAFDAAAKRYFKRKEY